MIKSVKLCYSRDKVDFENMILILFFTADSGTQQLTLMIYPAIIVNYSFVGTGINSRSRIGSRKAELGKVNDSRCHYVSIMNVQIIAQSIMEAGRLSRKYEEDI